MIDFVKIATNDLLKRELLNNDLLEFSAPVNLKTGVVNEVRIQAKYQKLKFEIVEARAADYINVNGSLHKYWHNGRNYTDYTFSDLLNTLIDLHSKFNVNPFEAVLHNVEYGVNISPPLSTKLVLNNLVSFKGRPFDAMHRTQGKSIGKDCYNQRYAVKIYDKGKQCQLTNDLLRVEVKVLKMEQLKNAGIETLSDLLDIDKLQQLGLNLRATFDDLLYYDTSINLDELKPRERQILMDWRNPAYWVELKESKPKTYDYQRRRFREITAKYSKDNQQKKISELVTEKWNELLIVDSKTLAKLTAFLQQFPEYKFSLINLSNSKLITPSLTPSVRRYCKSCKRDITAQVTTSIFCSAKYVGEDRAKQCRNTDSNPRNNRARSIKNIKRYPLLFAIEPYVNNRIIHTHYL